MAPRFIYSSVREQRVVSIGYLSAKIIFRSEESRSNRKGRRGTNGRRFHHQRENSTSFIVALGAEA